MITRDLSSTRNPLLRRIIAMKRTPNIKVKVLSYGPLELLDEDGNKLVTNRALASKSLSTNTILCEYLL